VDKDNDIWYVCASYREAKASHRSICRRSSLAATGSRGQEQWIEEFRYYRREDGLIVKERDDLISSTRYAIMMRRFAKQPPSVERWKPKPKRSAWTA
jgi:hypothetical protein